MDMEEARPMHRTRRRSDSCDAPVVYARSYIALLQERGTSSSRRRWMEYERQLRDRDSSDSEDVIVRKPPCNLRTDHKYDCEDCREWRNLRYIKRGPKGAVWEKKWAPVVAQGPPPEELRLDESYCWLCNAELQEHRRKWTRPGWTRKVGWSQPVGPYERVENKDNVTIWQYSKEKVVARYHRWTEEPPSQLDMTIYCCPNGCDADDALQALLDQTDHTGPQTRPYS